MKRTLASLTVILLAGILLGPAAYGQEDEEYRFDGMADEDPQPKDPTDWMTTENWSDGGSDPFGPPFGPLIPDFGTSVEVITSNFGVDAPVIGPGDVAEAFDVRIGRFVGEGLLTMTGGTLTTVDSCLAFPFTCNRRLRVGAAQVALPGDRHPGTFDLMDGVVTTDTLWIGSGSPGTMNMSGGVVNTRSNLSLDWTFDAGSVLNVTGGTINVGTSFDDNVRMYRNSAINLDGGEILVSGAAVLGLDGDPNSQGGVESPNVSVSISDGLFAADDFLQINGTLTIDGGIFRADSFNEATSSGTIEVNEGGTLQFNNAQESVSAVQGLVTSGVITTSSPQGTGGFVIEVVDVMGTNFTQLAFAMAGLAGDFNNDGRVNAADYVLWRDNLGAADESSLNGNGNGMNGVDQADYDLWVSNFGNSGSGSATQAATVPEPASAAIMLMMAATAVISSRRN